jgi:hypothetical protein
MVARGSVHCWALAPVAHSPSTGPAAPAGAVAAPATLAQQAVPSAHDQALAEATDRIVMSLAGLALVVLLGYAAAALIRARLAAPSRTGRRTRRMSAWEEAGRRAETPEPDEPPSGADGEDDRGDGPGEGPGHGGRSGGRDGGRA